jgi:hypothetical protein
MILLVSVRDFGPQAAVAVEENRAWIGRFS